MKDLFAQAQVEAGDLIFRRLPAYRGYLLSFWTEGGTSLEVLDKWLFVGLSHAVDKRYYDVTASAEERERIKMLCMAGASAIKWAKHYLSLGFPDRHTYALSMFAEIESLLATGTVRTVRQVACCSGREIAYFARRYPQVEFVGSDCDESLIGFLREQWKHLPNLAFHLIRLEGKKIDEARLSCDLLYASGGFHYMDPASLCHFFERIQPLVRRLFLSQPMTRSFAVEHERVSQARGQLSWNHPYVAFLQDAGWKNVRLIERTIAEFPHYKNVAVFAQSS